ncbi:hypothetical protein EVAR_12190_1 [Eumeta japonica]|uniref:Uncharacterized protein n=1 Tax=Eumeta variegata TaxID=151549 RepID=A0A4C1UGZ6_EUMVA|nr:hypothetical protein EVAR_12190_1 [Eumeta japonica]
MKGLWITGTLIYQKKSNCGSCYSTSAFRERCMPLDPSSLLASELWNTDVKWRFSHSKSSDGSLPRYTILNGRQSTGYSRVARVHGRRRSPTIGFASLLLGNAQVLRVSNSPPPHPEAYTGFAPPPNLLLEIRSTLVPNQLRPAAPPGHPTKSHIFGGSRALPQRSAYEACNRLLNMLLGGAQQWWLRASVDD